MRLGKDHVVLSSLSCVKRADRCAYAPLRYLWDFLHDVQSYFWGQWPVIFKYHLKWKQNLGGKNCSKNRKWGGRTNGETDFFFFCCPYQYGTCFTRKSAHEVKKYKLLKIHLFVICEFNSYVPYKDTGSKNSCHYISKHRITIFSILLGVFDY